MHDRTMERDPLFQSPVQPGPDAGSASCVQDESADGDGRSESDFVNIFTNTLAVLVFSWLVVRVLVGLAIAGFLFWGVGYLFWNISRIILGGPILT